MVGYISNGAGSMDHLFLIEQSIDAESLGDWRELQAGRLTPTQYAENERVRNVRRSVIRAQMRQREVGR